MVLKLNKGGQTLSNLTSWLLAKARKCQGRCWVVMVQKGSSGGKKKQRPSIKVGERRYGESPEFLTEGQSQGSGGVTIYASAKGRSGGVWGQEDGLEGASFKT